MDDSSIPRGADTPDDRDDGASLADDRPRYRLAYRDEEFLARPELRTVRLQHELLWPELGMQEHDVAFTTVVFGSSRAPAPEDAEDRLRPPDSSSACARKAGHRTRPSSSATAPGR